MEYKGYRIEPKCDFGNRPFLIKGQWVSEGFVVGKGYIGNIMPGATWFQTIEEAKSGIDNLIAADGDSDLFWTLNYTGRRLAELFT
jgi:hypothetical protein